MTRLLVIRSGAFSLKPPASTPGGWPGFCTGTECILCTSGYFGALRPRLVRGPHLCLSVAIRRNDWTRRLRHQPHKSVTIQEESFRSSVFCKDYSVCHAAFASTQLRNASHRPHFSIVSNYAGSNYAFGWVFCRKVQYRTISTPLTTYGAYSTFTPYR